MTCRPVPGVAGVGDLSGGDLQGGEQAGDAVPGIIVGLPLGDPGPHRQDRLCPLQGLALALLVDAQDDGVLGRVQVEADDLTRKVGIGRGQRRRSARTASNRERSGDIRAWAKDKGIPISDRGRIPGSLVERYEAASQGR